MGPSGMGWSDVRRTAAGEARQRVRRAGAALAGRRAVHWPLLVGLTAAGVVAGWFAAMTTRRALAVIASEAVRDEPPFVDEEISPSM